MVPSYWTGKYCHWNWTGPAIWAGAAAHNRPGLPQRLAAYGQTTFALRLFLPLCVRSSSQSNFRLAVLCDPFVQIEVHAIGLETFHLMMVIASPCGRRTQNTKFGRRYNSGLMCDPMSKQQKPKPRFREWYTCFWYEIKTGVVCIVVFNIDLCSATSIESSRRNILNDMAEHRPILENNQILSKNETPVSGSSIPVLDLKLKRG